MLAALIVAGAALHGCDAHSGRERASVPARATDTTLRYIGVEVGRALDMNVSALTLGRHRLDVEVAMNTAAANPDSEYRALRPMAESLWQRGSLGSVADTVAITVVRLLRPDSAMERNTYFYYRSERRAP